VDDFLFERVPEKKVEEEQQDDVTNGLVVRTSNVWKNILCPVMLCCSDKSKIDLVVCIVLVNNVINNHSFSFASLSSIFSFVVSMFLVHTSYGKVG
jgi:hypothetical protein